MADAPLGSTDLTNQLLQTASAQTGIPAQTFGSNVIPTTSLQTANPIQIATTPPDVTNHAGIIAGTASDLQAQSDAAQAKVDALNKAGSDTTNPDSISSQILSLMGQEGGKAADTATANSVAGVTQLNAQLADLNAQAKNLNLASQAIPIQTQERNANTGATDAGIAPQNAGALRENALQALSLSQQSNIAQGNLTAATAAATQAINLKYAPIEAQLATLQQQYTFNKDALTAANAKAATALQASITERTNNIAAQKLTAQNNVTNQTTWANNAYQAGQSDISSKITALDPGSPTFTSDLAALQSQIKLTPAQLYQIAQANALNGVTPPGTTPGAGTGAVNVASTAGITDTTIPLTQAIANVGINAIVQGIISNEGGTPQGTNNPGNIKFANQPNATIGKAAPDGGNYANFATAQAGKDAIANLLQSQTYNGLSFQDAINKYTNTYAKANAIGTTGSPIMDVTKPGYTTALVGATGWTQSALDQDALAGALGQPYPFPVARAGTGQAEAQKNAIAVRGGEMNAGGNVTANKATFVALQSALTEQTGYVNSLQGALTASEGGGQWIVNNAPTGINTNDSTFLNTKLNDLAKNFGNSDAIRKYQAALFEIGNEYSQVFQRGGTRNESGDAKAQSIVNGDITMSSLKGVLDTLQSLGKIAVTARQQQVDSINGQINGILGGHPGITIPSTGGNFSTGGYNINIPQK